MNGYMYVCKNNGCHKAYKMKLHLMNHEKNCPHNNSSVDLLLKQNKSKVEYNCVNNRCIEPGHSTDLNHSGDSCSYENPIISNKPKVLSVSFCDKSLFGLLSFYNYI